MTKERKAPKDWKTWADFANCYDLVLFNECTNLVHHDNKSYDEGVLYEWMEAHDCDANHGENEECTCEPMQWYAIGIGEFNAKFLNRHFSLDIFYSDVLGIYILPVYHYGTSWTHVSLSMNKTNDND
jgi:hypothetical protein